MAHRFSYTFQPTYGANSCQHVRGVGSLLASYLDPSALPTLLQQQIEEATFCSIDQQSVPKFGEHREVKAEVGQVQAYRVFPIDACAHGISGLSVGQLITHMA